MILGQTQSDDLLPPTHWRWKLPPQAALLFQATFYSFEFCRRSLHSARRRVGFNNNACQKVGSP